MFYSLNMPLYLEKAIAPLIHRVVRGRKKVPTKWVQFNNPKTKKKLLCTYIYVEVFNHIILVDKVDFKLTVFALFYLIFYEPGLTYLTRSGHQKGFGRVINPITDKS